LVCSAHDADDARSSALVILEMELDVRRVGALERDMITAISTE